MVLYTDGVGAGDASLRREVRIRRRHDIAHHGARTTTSEIHPAPVDFVRLDGVRDHVGDGLRVAAAAAHERAPRRHVPAGALVRGRRPERDVPLAVGALVPGDLGVLEVGLGRGLAGVWGPVSTLVSVC